MKTYNDFAKLITDREYDLAPNSETGLLEAAVELYGYMQSLISNNNELDISLSKCKSSDELYKLWSNAYDKLSENNKDGIECNISDLF